MTKDPINQASDGDELELDEVEAPADQSAQLAAARSWIKKFVKDAYADRPQEGEQDKRFGVVVDAVQEDVIRLLARFPGEAEPRRIALEPHPDGHYLSPKDVKARYRRLTATDVDELKALAARRRAA